MATYYYKALNGDGELIDGSVDAPSREAALAALRRTGYLPVHADATRPKRSWADLLTPSSGWFSRPKNAPITLLTSELATLLAAGLPVDASLKTLERVVGNAGLRESVRRLRSDMQQGAGVGQAFSNQPAVFSPFFVAVVRAGEADGHLAGAFHRLTAVLSARDELRRSVVSSLTYPILLVLVATLSVVFLLLFVVPQFVPLFDDVGGALPLPTRMLLWLSNALRSYWWTFAAVVLVAVVTGRVWLQRPESRRATAAAVMRTPKVRDLVQAYETAQFARTLETLLHGGVPLLNAMRLAVDVISNTVVREDLAGCLDGIRDGTSLSELLQGTQHLPPLVAELTAVGEQTGQLPEMLAKLADIYDITLRDTTKKLLTILEPALILGMGAVVGGIIAAVLTALLALNDLVIA